MVMTRDNYNPMNMVVLPMTAVGLPQDIMRLLDDYLKINPIRRLYDAVIGELKPIHRQMMIYDYAEISVLNDFYFFNFYKNPVRKHLVYLGNYDRVLKEIDGGSHDYIDRFNLYIR